MAGAVEGPPKVLGAILLDLDQNGLGLPSLAGEPFAATTVLGQTLRQLARCRQVPLWVLVAPVDQWDRIRSIVGAIPGLTWRFEPWDLPSPDWQSWIRRARKWSLANWRGGVARSTLLDEECNPAQLADVAARHQADWIVQVRAESPLADPALIDGLVERALQTTPAPPLMYGSIPPGLAGWAYRRDFLEELGEKGVFPGLVLGYRPWEPTIDLTEQLFAYKTPVAVARLAHRLLADHQEGLRIVRRFESDADPFNALGIANTLAANPDWRLPSVPGELEIEITTNVSVPHRYRRPGQRPDLAGEQFERILRPFVDQTDLSLVTLTGQGDPLAHPDWPDLLERAHRVGVHGLGIVTDGLALDANAGDVLMGGGVDLVCVTLDGHNPKSYQAIHGEDRYQHVVENLERLLDRRGAWGTPLVVVSMIKVPETLGGMLEFFDRWSARADAALIAGASDLAGAIEPIPILDVEPPTRAPCRRIERRMTLLSDGTIATCSEDALLRQPIGSAFDADWLDHWRTGGGLAQLRKSHREGRFDAYPSCSRCRQWHRP